MIAYFMVSVKTIGVNTVFSIQKYAKHEIAGICNEILYELRCTSFIRIRFGFIDVVRDNFWLEIMTARAISQRESS